MDDLQTLVDFGLFNREGVAKLSSLIRTVQALTGGALGATAPKRRGRPPKAAGAAMNGRPAGTGKRGRRSKLTATKDELAAMRKSGMTAKAIAAKYGVSMGAVNLHLRKHGLTNPGKRGRPAKKK
jgi:hypothetical protein